MRINHALGGILTIALLGAGCVAETGDPADEQGQEQGEEPAGGEPELSETSSAITEGNHYCVDQSYASAERLGGYSNVCWRSPIWSTTLSNGHKVTAATSCGAFSSAYTIVYSHWNGAYYYMRKDALTPC